MIDLDKRGDRAALQDAAPAPAPQVEFVGLAGDFFLMQLLNLLLTIVTLGFYRFWAKARFRRYLWAHTELGGDALEYRGTGLELLIGAILVVLLISVPFGIVSILAAAASGGAKAVLLATQSLLVLAIWYLIGVGIYRSWRYMLSRTGWRGIRSGMVGQGWSFGLYHFGLLMAQAFSLGFATPWVGVRRWNRLVNDIRLGSLPMEANARSRALYPRFLIVWGVMLAMVAILVGTLAAGALASDLFRDPTPSPAGLLLFVLSLYGGLFAIGFVGALLFAHYHAAFLRETWGATRIDGRMQLGFDVTTGQVIRYYLGNMALIIFTLGIGTLLLPYRHWAFQARRIRIDGSFDEDAMRQTDLAAPGQGDGLADAFDVTPF